tara:strand:- start:11088 stop:12269 length:1182 start_codon:yes stop_codon:yes gene_type:complete
MTKENFHEKIALILIFLIFNNYFILSLNFSLILVKINFIIFLSTIVFYYSYQFRENIYFKIFFLFIIIMSLGTPTFDWDPRSIWLFHAKRIFYDISVFSVSDNYAMFSHNDYPNLVPAFSSSLAVLIGDWNEIFPKLSFLFMAFPPMIFAYSFLKETKYLIFLSLVFFIVGKFLFNGWADGLLALYFSVSAFLMYEIIIKNQTDQKKGKEQIYNILAVFFFSSLTLIKNEGLALLVIIFFSAFIINIYKRNIYNKIYKYIFLFISFVPIILWKIFCYSNELGNDYLNANLLENLLPRIDNLDNYLQIAYFLLLNEKFILSLIFFLLIFLFNPNKELFIFVALLTLFYLFILFFVFLSTPADFYFQLNSAAARVIKSLSLMLGFFAIFNMKLNK